MGASAGQKRNEHEPPNVHVVCLCRQTASPTRLVEVRARAFEVRPRRSRDRSLRTIVPRVLLSWAAAQRHPPPLRASTQRRAAKTRPHPARKWCVLFGCRRTARGFWSDPPASYLGRFALLRLLRHGSSRRGGVAPRPPQAPYCTYWCR